MHLGKYKFNLQQSRHPNHKVDGPLRYSPFEGLPGYRLFLVRRPEILPRSQSCSRTGHPVHQHACLWPHSVKRRHHPAGFLGMPHRPGSDYRKVHARHPPAPVCPDGRHHDPHLPSPNCTDYAGPYDKCFRIVSISVSALYGFWIKPVGSRESIFRYTSCLS